MDPFIRPSDKDDPIGRLNRSLFGGLTGQTDDPILSRHREQVLGRANQLEAGPDRTFTIGELGLINESRIEQLAAQNELDVDDARSNVAEWYNYFADEYDADPENVDPPVARTNKWLSAKLSSAQSEKEAEAIKTGGMSDVGRFIGEMAKAPVDVPFRAGVDVGNMIEGDKKQQTALFGTSPEKDPVKEIATDSQFIGGLTGVQRNEEANFLDRFDPETGEIVKANVPGALAGVVGLGVREVTKALALASGLGAIGATEAVGAGATKAATKLGGGQLVGAAAKEIAESIPLFVALGAAGRGEAGEGFGSAGDLALDAGTGALFGSISAAFQTLGRYGITKNLEKTSPELASLRTAMEKSEGKLTADVSKALAKLGKLDEIETAAGKAIQVAKAIDKGTSAAEVGSQFLAGYLVDRLQGVSHEEAAVNGLLFGVLDVARAKGLRIAENEIMPLRRTVEKMVSDNPSAMLGDLTWSEFSEFRSQQNPGAEPIRMVDLDNLPEGARIEPVEANEMRVTKPESGDVFNYQGQHVEYDHVPPTRKTTLSEPPEVWLRKQSKRIGSAIRKTKDLPKNVLGRWFHSDGRSELRFGRDLTTGYHEAWGHGLDMQYDVMPKEIELAKMPPDESNALINEMSMYFRPAPGDRINESVAESFASFMQAYMRDPDGTAARSPMMYQRYVEKVPEKIRNLVVDHSEQYRGYLSSPEWAKAGTQIVTQADLTMTPIDHLKAIVKELTGQDVQTFSTGYMDKFKTEMIDRFSNILKAEVFKRTARTGEKLNKDFRISDIETERILRLHAGGEGERQEVYMNVGIPEVRQDTEGAVDVVPGTEGGWIGKVFGKIPEESVVDTLEFLRQLDVYMANIRVGEVADNLVADLTDATDAQRADIEAEAIKRIEQMREDGRQFAEKLMKRAKESGREGDVERAKEMIRENDIETRGIIRRMQTQLTQKLGRLEKSFERKLKKLYDKDYSGMAPREGGRGLTDANFAVEVRREIEDIAEAGGYLQNLIEAAQGARDMTAGAMQYMADAGRISQDSVNYMLERNPFYATMNRVMNLDDMAFSMFADSTSHGLQGRLNLFQKAEGSERPIRGIVESMIQKASLLISEADKNRILQSFTEGLAPSPRERLSGNRHVLNTIGQKLHTAYFDPETNSYTSQKKFTPNSSDNLITVFRNIDGRHAMETWHIPDHGLYSTLTGLNKTTRIPTAIKLVAIPQQVAKWSITHSPFYAVRNVERDVLSGQIVGSKGRKLRDIPSVVKDVATQSPMYRLFQSLGGSGAGMFGRSRDHYARYQRALQKRAAASGPLSLFAPFGKMVSKYVEAVEMSEHIGRMMEFRGKQRELMQKYPDMPMSEINQRAAYSARESADFATIGNTMVHLNHFIPFTNAAVQSLRGTWEKFNQDPHAATGKWFLYAAAPSVMAYLASKGGGYEEEYMELPDYQRDFFWNFKVAPNMWVRVPKPFEMGVLASGFERAMVAAIKADPEQLDGWTGSLRKAAIPIEGWDQMLGPMKLLAELTTNYDFFRERPIIPMHEADLHPDLREGRKNASRFGKAFQKMSGMDGRQFDYVLRALFGDFGKIATQVSDIGRDDKQFRWQDFVSVRGPVSASKSVRDVLDAAELYGESSSNQHVRQLRRLLSIYYDVESDVDRDEMGKAIREYAKTLKQFIPIWREKVKYVRDY